MTSGPAPAFEPPYSSPAREAVPGDNDALLELTRSCPMEGDIGLCIDRGPDFFRLCVLGNAGFRVGVIPGSTGTLIGCATIAERRVWVHGQPIRVAFASDLKVDHRHRRTGAASQLIRWVAEQSRRTVGEAGPILSTVLSGNEDMERLFPGGPGLIRIQPFAKLRAHAIPVFHRPPPEARFGVDVASWADHLELRELWNRYAPARQLAPLAPVGLGPLPPASGARFSVPCHFVARNRAGGIEGFLGIWDEQAVKQLRVTGYSVRLGAARTAINLLAPFIGAERLPGAGKTLRSGTVVDLCVPPDAPEVLRALLLAANRAATGSGISFLTLGLDARDPLSRGSPGRRSRGRPGDPELRPANRTTVRRAADRPPPGHASRLKDEEAEGPDMSKLESPRELRRVCHLGLCVGLLMAPLALAQSDSASPPTAPGVRFEMSLGAGLAVPITFSRQDPAALGASLPLRAEVGLRIEERTFFGLLGEYVPASDMQCCCAASPGYCSASTGRFGLELQYHFGAMRKVHPWIGVAGGLELLHLFASGDLTGSGNYETNTSTSQGWFGEVQLGLDVPIGQVFRLGPWIQFSLGSIGGDLSDYGGNIRGRVGGGIRFGIVL